MLTELDGLGTPNETKSCKSEVLKRQSKKNVDTNKRRSMESLDKYSSKGEKGRDSPCTARPCARQNHPSGSVHFATAPSVARNIESKVRGTK
jgi:hypothetical protein